MGRLIKNGISYGGSASSAEKLKYDNTNSSLDSSTVQAAIDELFAKINTITSITLTTAGWQGETEPYSQTVAVNGVKETDNVSVVSMLESDATLEEQKAYNKAFGIICSGSGITANNSVTFYVYSQPEIDITIGLKGV